MADCVFSMSGPSRLQDGQQATYTMSPPLRPGCSATYELNGQQVTTGKEVGDLKVVGITATGDITLQATDDDPAATLVVTLECRAFEREPACGPTPTKVLIGGGFKEPLQKRDEFKALLGFGMGLLGLGLGAAFGGIPGVFAGYFGGWGLGLLIGWLIDVFDP